MTMYDRRWTAEHDERLTALEGVQRPAPEQRGQLAFLRQLVQPMTARAQRVDELAARWADLSERRR